MCLELERARGILRGDTVRTGEQHVTRRARRSPLKLERSLHHGERRPVRGGGSADERRVGQPRRYVAVSRV